MGRAVITFLAVAYTLAVTLSVVVSRTGGHDSPLVGLGFLAMFLPALAVLVVRWVVPGTAPSAGWDCFPARYVPLALFLMPVVMHAVMLPTTVALAGRLPWVDWLTPQADGLYHTPASRGWGVVTIYGLVGRIALNAVIGAAVVCVLALFEEVGWRAWLLPRLAERIGARQAVVVVALVWAGWHVPFALSGVQHIDGVSATSLALRMPLGIAASGLILGWLWLRTESVWMVALAHGTFNNWGQYAFKYIQDGPGVDWRTVLSAGGPALLVVGVLLLAFFTPEGQARHHAPQ